LFVGVTEQYERSDRPELTIDTARLDVPAASRLLLASVLQFLGPGHD
jgi:adenylylsulfate kinase-like enzyme